MVYTSWPEMSENPMKCYIGNTNGNTSSSLHKTLSTRIADLNDLDGKIYMGKSAKV